MDTIDEHLSPGLKNELHDFDSEMAKKFATGFSKIDNTTSESDVCHQSCAAVQLDCNDVSLNIFFREEDSDEQDSLDTFKCTCCLGGEGSPCYQNIPKSIVAEYRNSISELSKEERDLVILSQISSNRTRKDIEYGGVRPSRARSFHYFAHLPICQDTFRFLHLIGQKQHENLIKHLETYGLTPRVHGNKGKQPHNAFLFEDRVHVKNFIENVAVARGIPLPGRLPNVKDLSVTLLPTNCSKAELHREYHAACNADNRKPFSLSAFKLLWQSLCPQVRISKPSSDLCEVCQKNNMAIIRSANLPEAIKADKLKTALQHLDEVKKQRDHYRYIFISQNPQSVC